MLPVQHVTNTKKKKIVPCKSTKYLNKPLKSNVYFTCKGHLSWGGPISDGQTSLGDHEGGWKPPLHSSLNKYRSQPTPRFHLPPGVRQLGLHLESESWVSTSSRKGHQEPPPAALTGRFLPRAASTPSLSVKSNLLKLIKLIKLCNCEIFSN